MTNAVRIGLIGTSWWADMAHLPLFKADERVQMVAICGRNQERAQAMAAKYAIPNTFSDYRAMIAQSNLDAIVISTPDDEHYAMTMAALDAGLHVLCEKPLALNATDAKAMFDKAEAKGVRHMTFFLNRWLPHYRTMRQLVEQGVLGRLYHAHFSYISGGGRTPHYQWRFDRTRANGVVGDLGAHLFDLAHYLVGDIGRVSAHLGTHVRREGVNGQPVAPASDAATIALEFANGGQGSMAISAVARTADPIQEQQVALHGEAGSLVAQVKLGSIAQLLLATGNDPFQPVPIPVEFARGMDLTQPPITQMAPLFTQHSVGGRLFVDAILAKRPLTPSFYEGWKAQQVIDAVLRSGESGQWVSV